MQWPDYFPENCPPEHAEPASGEVYRMIEKSAPTEQDFKSFRELNPRRRLSRKMRCRACGLSVYTEPQDILILRRQVPRFRTYSLSKGELEPRLGKLLHTPSRKTGESHHTWWVPVGAEPEKVFTAVPIPQGG